MTDTPTEEPALVRVTLTCHTEGCGNAGIPIALDVPENLTAAMCGVCRQPITDQNREEPS